MANSTFGRITRLLSTGARSRRATIQAVVGTGFGGVLALRNDAAGAARCKKRQKPCTKKSQCCGKKVRCATSHGAGADTCCGGLGATCSSDLTCCVPLDCRNGRCRNARPE
jgi:hypothetical protein